MSKAIENAIITYRNGLSVSRRQALKAQERFPNNEARAAIEYLWISGLIIEPEYLGYLAELV